MGGRPGLAAFHEKGPRDGTLDPCLGRSCFVPGASSGACGDEPRLAAARGVACQMGNRNPPARHVRPRAIQVQRVSFMSVVLHLINSTPRVAVSSLLGTRGPYHSTRQAGRQVRLVHILVGSHERCFLITQSGAPFTVCGLVDSTCCIE